MCFNILLAALILIQAFCTSIILINFKLNQEEIAKTLCVKKEEPLNCCQGSCHLKKQLQAEEKKEQTPVNNGKLLKQAQLFCSHKMLFEFGSSLIIGEAFSPFQQPKTIPYSVSVFHPPC